MTWFNRVLHIWGILLVLLLLFFPTGSTMGETQNQQTEPQLKAKELLDKMAPEERVGQLFLVNLKGRDITEKSQIYDLIAKHNIGGVILSNANDNFTGPDSTTSDAYNLISTLQSVGWNSPTTSLGATVTQGQINTDYSPLFIGISQEGDQYPNDQLINGVTSLPDLMAIGATWDTNLSQEVGNVMGSEMSALGFNLFFGPSLDVLDILQVENNDLGTSTFGGDPYWVGEMGKAYISGLHQGSKGRIAVIPAHFPGMGGADRSPENEIATVRKPVEQLKQVDLAPFISVVANQNNPENLADGFLVANIRYQSFQGNVRDITRPISFDAAAMDQLLGYPEFSSWRQNGGMMVSDDLSSQAVRRFYDPLENNFDARQVARDAFLAGNDLINMGNMVSTGDADKYSTVIRTLDFFTQKYREDTAFAKKVDAAVTRILTIKFRLYPSFDLERVLPSKSNLAKTIGTSQDIVVQVAQKAATLISPNPTDLSASLPHPPEKNEKIVFITDSISGHQCSTCPDQPILTTDALQNAVVRLYGPNASGQVFPYRLVSYSFQDLDKYLNNVKEPGTTEDDIKNADWVVFSILNIQKNRPESSVLKRILSERPELLRNKNVVVFSFNAPYYLDATDISKITAYYGLYSKESAFVDVAARILFQEFVPGGALPVTVPGVGYDLKDIVAPDANQIIPLMVDTDALYSKENLTKTPLSPGDIISPTPVPRFKVGDTLPLVTGPIYDKNHNPVPDGTTVRFLFATGGEGGTVQQIATTTTNGVAKSSYRIQNSGLLEIRVVCDPATQSSILQLDNTPGVSAAITAIAPTSIVIMITATPEPTHTPIPPTPTLTPEKGLTTTGTPNAFNWLISMILVLSGGIGIFWAGKRVIPIRWGIRFAFTTVIGGQIFYLYLALGLPGSKNLLEKGGNVTLMIFVVIGMLVGWGIGKIWERIAR